MRGAYKYEISPTYGGGDSETKIHISKANITPRQKKKQPIQRKLIYESTKRNHSLRQYEFNVNVTYDAPKLQVYNAMILSSTHASLWLCVPLASSNMISRILDDRTAPKWSVLNDAYVDYLANIWGKYVLSFGPLRPTISLKQITMSSKR